MVLALTLVRKRRDLRPKKRVPSLGSSFETRVFGWVGTPSSRRRDVVRVHDPVPTPKLSLLGFEVSEGLDLT